MSIVVVLQKPQDLVNIASVVRAMKNFELDQLRVVAPEEYDDHRIEGIAHNSYDILERARQCGDLDEALADCSFVVGMTARERTAKRSVVRPRDVAPEVLAASREGRAAIVLGPEDRGLTNEELDRCDRAVTIPSNPDYASLNLAQAFTIMAYELSVARGVRVLKTPRREAPPASHEELEALYDSAQRALDAIEFFKTRNPEIIMRSVREVTHRAGLDAREAKLVRAMCYEVVHFLERQRPS